ncbi:unnamed protein product [Orchesella dallaii]|uniref:Uncharacterized protein n=1 Tax=Orchesella dallaii TaxID=48710 RepID=A0ABP1S1D8_9HEXA
MEQEVEAGGGDNDINMENRDTQRNSVQNQRSQFPQQYPPPENDELITWPPEHEVVVFRVRNNSRHHRRDRNDRKQCTEDECLCDGSLVLDTEETFRRALYTVAECRSRMCPKTLKNCLSDPRLGVFFTWFELGPEWGEFPDDDDNPTRLTSPESNNSTRNNDLIVENVSDQAARDLPTTRGEVNGSPDDESLLLEVTNTSSVSNVSSTSPSSTGNENTAPGHNAGSGVSPAVTDSNSAGCSAALNTQEPSTTYCALILKTLPSSSVGQDTGPQLLRPSSPSGNAETLETRKDERSDPDIEDSCATLAMKTKIIQLSSHTSASLENTGTPLNKITNLTVAECDEEEHVITPTYIRDSTVLHKAKANPINESESKNEVQNAELLDGNKKSSKGKVDLNFQTIEIEKTSNVLKATSITSKVSRKRIKAVNNNLVSPTCPVEMSANEIGHDYPCDLNITSKHPTDLPVDSSTAIEPSACSMDLELKETNQTISETTTTSVVINPTDVVSPDSGCGISPSNLGVASSSSIDLGQNEQAKLRKRNMPNVKRNSRPAPASIKRARAAAATPNSFESPNYLEEINKIRKIVDFHTVEDDRTEAMTTVSKQTLPTTQSNARSDKDEDRRENSLAESISNDSKAAAAVSCDDESPTQIMQTVTNNEKWMSKNTCEPSKLNLRSDSIEMAADHFSIDPLDVQIISEAESELDDSENSEVPLINRLNRKNRRKKKALNATQHTEQINNRASDDDDVQFLEEVSVSSMTGSNITDVNTIANSKNAYSCNLFSNYVRKSRSNSWEDENARESFESSKKAGVKDDDEVKGGVSKPTVSNSIESIRITFDKSKAINVPAKSCDLNKDDDLLTGILPSAGIEIETDRPGWEFKGLPPPRIAHQISGCLLQNSKLQENSSLSKATPTSLEEKDKSIELGSENAHKKSQVLSPQKKTTFVSTLEPSDQNKASSVSSPLPSTQEKTTSMPTQPTTTSKTLRNKNQSFDPRTEAVKISPKPIAKVSKITESLQSLSSKERLPSPSAEFVAKQDEDKSKFSARPDKMSNSTINRKADLTKSQSSKTGSRVSNSNASFVDGEIRMFPVPAETRNNSISSGTSRVVSNQRQGDSCAQSSKANRIPVRAESPSASNSSSNSSAPAPSNKSQLGHDGVKSSGSRNENFPSSRQGFALRGRGGTSRGRQQTHNKGGRGREGRSERPNTQRPMSPPHSTPSSSATPLITLSVGVDAFVNGSSHQQISPSSSDVASSVRGRNRNPVSSSFDDSQRQKRSHSESSSHVSDNARKRKNRGKKGRSGGTWRRGLYNPPVGDNFGVPPPHPPYYENEFEHPTMYSQPQQNRTDHQNMPWAYPRGRGNHYNNRVRSNYRRFNYD